MVQNSKHIEMNTKFDRIESGGEMFYFIPAVDTGLSVLIFLQLP